MKLCAAMLVALGVSMAAWAGYDDRFGYFQEQGVMDPAVSSEVTNALVREGIASNDPDTVDRVIRGLGNLASMMAHKRPNAYGEMPSRTFATVPGLKEFLIEHWRKQHKNTGRNVFETIVDDMGFESQDGRTVTIPSAAERGQTEGEEEASLESAIADWRNRLDPWVMIPQVLSVFWPKDPDVEQFLYEMQHTDEGETTALTTLFLLNVGKFTSSEANAFRIDQLRDSNEGMGAPTAVAWAAEGLALSHPNEALPALIEAGQEHPWALGAVVTALAGYDQSQTGLYVDEIRELLKDGVGVMPTDAVTEAFDKLDRFVNSVP